MTSVGLLAALNTIRNVIGLQNRIKDRQQGVRKGIQGFAFQVGQVFQAHAKIAGLLAGIVAGPTIHRHLVPACHQPFAQFFDAGLKAAIRGRYASGADHGNVHDGSPLCEARYGCSRTAARNDKEQSSVLKLAPWLKQAYNALAVQLPSLSAINLSNFLSSGASSLS